MFALGLSHILEALVFESAFGVSAASLTISLVNNPINFYPRNNKKYVFMVTIMEFQWP